MAEIYPDKADAAEQLLAPFTRRSSDLFQGGYAR
jgi:hypothetical protein